MVISRRDLDTRELQSVWKTHQELEESYPLKGVLFNVKGNLDLEGIPLKLDVNISVIYGYSGSDVKPYLAQNTPNQVNVYIGDVRYIRKMGMTNEMNAEYESQIEKIIKGDFGLLLHLGHHQNIASLNKKMALEKD